MNYGKWNWEFSPRAWYCLRRRGLAIVEGIFDCWLHYMQLVVLSLFVVHEGVFSRVMRCD